MQFTEGNNAAEYTIEEITELIERYIKHRAEGFSKESFVDCDYRTVEKHIENPVLKAKKLELQKAERQGILYWEKLGRDLASGKIQGNPTSWIFNVKNRLGWKDKTEVENSHSFKDKPTINLVSQERSINEAG